MKKKMIKKRPMRYKNYFLVMASCVTVYSMYLAFYSGPQSIRYMDDYLINVERNITSLKNKTTRRGTTLPVLKRKTTFEPARPSISNQGRNTNISNQLVKIYIYDLNSEFNTDIIHCIQSKKFSSEFSECFDYSNHGMGKLLYKDGGISVHDTNQFSLDVLLHHQLLHSRYRTDSPSEADVFYVPAYLGSLFFCLNSSMDKPVLIQRLFEYLNNRSYLAEGKPHVTSLSKIELEQLDIVLSNPWWKNMTYITIEKIATDIRNLYSLQSQRAIVAPYPSYVHFDYSTADGVQVNLLPPPSRRLFLFLAASLRRSNPFRSKIIDQFPTKTELSFTEYYRSEEKGRTDQVMLVTTECMGNHKNTTIRWMQNAVFCLQPHGDSPTRKSFYDSILSGCIPVVFKFPTENVEFPFQRTLNYTDFIVRIPVDFNGDLKGNITVHEFLRQISLTEINRLHRNLIKVLPLFQYPTISGGHHKKLKDSVDMIVDEIKAMYNL